MLDRLLHMLRKEFIQVLRNPRMRAVVFLMPVVQVVIIGYAVNTDVRHVRTAVYDLATERWTAIAMHPQDVLAHEHAVSANGDVMALSGFLKNSKVSGRFQQELLIYDLRRTPDTQLALPQKRK